VPFLSPFWRFQWISGGFPPVDDIFLCSPGILLSSLAIFFTSPVIPFSSLAIFLYLPAIPFTLPSIWMQLQT